MLAIRSVDGNLPILVNGPKGLALHHGLAEVLQQGSEGADKFLEGALGGAAFEVQVVLQDGVPIGVQEGPPEAVIPVPGVDGIWISLGLEPSVQLNRGVVRTLPVGQEEDPVGAEVELQELGLLGLLPAGHNAPAVQHGFEAVQSYGRKDVSHGELLGGGGRRVGSAEGMDRPGDRRGKVLSST